ncbi:hypothetical protein [Bradyrhizobium sp. RT5a]|uniref:hypothetical protein n=1 Tax=Bradyrhizobium sp. RT5a TaxID=3156380 RepID=UPI00339443A9
MGQAKRRDAELKTWLASLSPAQKVVADAAQRVVTRYVDPAEGTGMCYRLSFFLHLYLLSKGVRTAPVVGYVNDGTDDIFMSHAWVAHEDKKTDVTLHRPERPHLNPAGDLLILDFPFRRAHKYSYHLTKSQAAIDLESELLKDPRGGMIVRHKAEEHVLMSRRAQSAEAMRAYLDSAPDGTTYNRFVSIIEE